MANPVPKEFATDPRTIQEPANDELLSGLLSKAVVFFDGDGQPVAAHCEVERLRPWVNGLLQKPNRALPAPLRNVLEQILTGRERFHRGELAIPASTGVLESFHASGHATFSPLGHISGATIAIYDLSPVRELNQNLSQLVRLASIGTLAAGMAHEIKNAMVAVKTFVDLLVSKNQDSELAGIVGREVRRIDNIVAQMLRVSGPARTAFTPVRVHELLDHAISVAQHRMAGSRITLERNLNADPDVAMGDSSQLEQAFMNLLFNAIEAMGGHGRLTIASHLTHRPDSTPVIQLTITDTGMGIPPENLHRLFEPFFTTKATGHGLGLVITRRIIVEHQGTITVRSQPGEGTHFTIEIPSAARQP